MLGFLFPVFLPSSPKWGRESDDPNDYHVPDYPDNPNAYSGRWTQNEINVQHNIDMGMAVKQDD